ncbi:MAG TPA: DUF2330 domain-containing protein [Kofleriaceae bacterium]|nr:DUF2330 domain-containing protein [Kofleriaceae bacterium]
MRFLVSIGAAAAAMVAVPAVSAAFCGFYVSGADAELYNNATQVVMMREGTRTVLSMQNNYQGPPSDFAMVVPVPVVLQKENVKTLPREIFRKVDSLSAPRLVEYWEQDPCMQRMEMEEGAVAKSAPPSPAPSGGASARDLGVTIEAKFTVGEYQIVILSAKDSTGLDTWLRQEKYKIPDGAEPYLKPYVEAGSKFFVARVDIEKVKFENGQAMLSPLRFHYDADEFSLPIRLGMINSAGTQDLLVHILAPNQRYEVANYPNATIPTNLDVREEARGRFGEFYAALFDRTVEKHPGAVVTEYSWDAGSCDPCPEPPLEQGELATLGADVLYGPPMPKTPPKAPARKLGDKPRDAVDELMADKSVTPPPAPPPRQFQSFVLTRLHARYGKDGIREDLVFKAAQPIAGGREWRGAEGKLEEGSIAAPSNNFQGRYAIRHEWTGPIACANPVRGVWGGPPAGQQIAAGAGQPKPALDLAFVARGKTQLAQIVKQDVPEIGLVAGKVDDKKPTEPSATTEPAAGGQQPVKKEKKGCAVGGADASWLGGLFAGVLALGVRRRRRAGSLERSHG